MAKYYNSNTLFSHNALVNLVMSGRGTGKSYEGKKIVIRNWIKDKSQSVYVRRTKVELDGMKSTYWNDISLEYPHLEFSVKGDIGYINDEEVVHFIPLSTSLNKKSASYPLVKHIIFDEYIITHTSYTRYLKNEVTLLFDLIETIGRSRDNIKVLLLANSVSYVNPLFTFFNIEITDNKKRFHKFVDGLLCVELFESTEFIKDKVQTRFAKLIQNTAYSKYAIGNETLEDNTEFIKERQPVNYQYICTLKSNGFEVGVWINNTNCEYFVDKKIDTGNINKFTILISDNQQGYQNIREHRNSWRIREIKKNFYNSNLYYCNQEVKKFMENVIKYL